MAYLIALAALSLVSVVASVWLIRTDGYRPVPTDAEQVARRRETSRRAERGAPIAAPSHHESESPARPAHRDPARADRPVATGTRRADPAEPTQPVAPAGAAPRTGTAPHITAPRTGTAPHITGPRTDTAPHTVIDSGADHVSRTDPDTDTRTLVGQSAD